MKNLLDYGWGVCPNGFMLDDINRNVESILDMEPAGSELGKEMLAAWREWRLANLKFGRLLRQQDERLFRQKVSKQ
jgi:hypothetical protein